MRYLLRICLSGLFLFVLFISAVIADGGPYEIPLNVFNGPIPSGDRYLFVAPGGDNENSGTEEEPWATLDYAVSRVQRGDVIVMRGGVYYHDETIRIISTIGTEQQRSVITAYPGEVPILDFDALPKERNYHGIRLNGFFWHLIGITIRYASHNGIRMDGGYNILEQLTAYRNHDSGIHMAGGAAYNLIKNCDSFHNFNYDVSRTPRIGNNADGFSAKFDALGPGNRYYGCRAWENSDDGFDFWRAPNTIIVENCWAFGNGDAEALGYTGDDFEGNGNGFKLGGDNIATPHIVIRSLAFDNFGSDGNAKGFDYNNNPAAMTLLHNTAYNNGRNYVFPWTIEGQSFFINNLSAKSNQLAQIPPFPAMAAAAGNSWQTGITVTDDMFMSVDTAPAKGPRQADGSLPDIPLLVPKPDTFIIDGGVAAGEPFYGAAPDIGAYEYITGEPVDPWIERGSGAFIGSLLVYDMQNGDDWDILDSFEEGMRAFGSSTGNGVNDNGYIISGISGRLQIDEWIRPSLHSRTKNFLSETAEFELLQERNIFVAHDDRITVKPPWLSDYEMTDMKVVVSDTGNVEHIFSVFMKAPGAGAQVTLGRNSIDGTENAPMYMVMAGNYGLVSVDRGDPGIPEGFSLSVYPNPFNSMTNISYTLDVRSHVRLDIFDVTGRLVDTPVKGVLEGGAYTERFNAGTLASGLYFVRLNAGGKILHHRMILLR